MADNTTHDDLDFSDLDLDGADTGFDEGVEAEGEEAGPAKAKSSPMLLYVFVGLLVLAGAGGIAAWQMGLFGPVGGAQPAPITAPTPVMDPAMQQSDPFAVMGTPDQLPQPGMPTGGDPAMAMAEAMNQQAPISVDPANGLPQDQMPPVALTPEGEMPVTSVMPAIDAAGMPLTDDSGTTTTTTTTTITAEGSTVPMPEPVPADSGPTPLPDMNGLPAADTTLSPDVFQPIPEAVAPMPAVEKVVIEETKTTTPAPAPVDTAEVDALKQEVADLKAELAALRAERVEAAKAAPAPVIEEAAPKAAPKKKVAVKRKAATRKKSTSAWDKPYNGGAILSGESSSASAAPATAATTSSGGTYVLRAAQVGAAWIADGSGRLQEVRVGDTLPGVGTVRSIEQSNGAWTIQGSGGRIAQ